MPQIAAYTNVKTAIAPQKANFRFDEIVDLFLLTDAL